MPAGMLTKTRKGGEVMKKRQVTQIRARLFYSLAAAFDLWILHLTLWAAGIPISAWLWWGGWGALYGTLHLALPLSQTALGQLLGRGMTYAFSLHALLLWAAAGSLCLLAGLSFWGTAGIRAAGRIGLLLFLAGTVTCIRGFCAAHRLHLRRFFLDTSKVLPGGRLRIVHLSDLHLGFIQNARFAADLVRRVNALCPDLVCITGDIFSDTLRPIAAPGALADVLSGLRARFGVFACLGNHDAGEEDEMTSFLARAGIRVLIDEALFPAANVSLIGRSDATPGGVSAKRPPIGECLVGTDPLQYRIVLDHQPGAVEATSRAGADLLLCGHTHGGQFFPIRLFIEKRFPFCTGLHRYGTMTVSVNPGSGAGAPPIRIGSRGEIYLLTVRQSDVSSV